MKKFTYTLLTVLLATFVASAQTNVKLEIKHKQGVTDLALNQASTTVSGETYNAKRIEYYIAEVALEHDGGQITPLDSFWILVNAFAPKTYDLGQLNVTSLEAIRFSIGVEQSLNHLDPSLWKTGHPLAPKSPSMHWGWSAGYRFFAMEGRCSSTFQYTYELHSLGDNYYFDQRIETAGTDDAGDLLITLNADYDRVFDDLTLGTGMVDHGEFPNNVQSLKNIRDRVFTSVEGNGNSMSPILSVSNVAPNNDLKIYPNPSANGNINVSSNALDLSGADVLVYDNVGRMVYQTQVSQWNGLLSLELSSKGMHSLSIQKEGQLLLRESIVVTE